MITMTPFYFLLTLLIVMGFYFFMGYKIGYWNCEFKKGEKENE